MTVRGNKSKNTFYCTFAWILLTGAERDAFGTPLLEYNAN